MALISCPECGRKNISDTAEQCPECGYAVKEHFLREERKKRIAEEEWRMGEKISAENERLEPELNRKLAEIDRLCPRSKPEEPKKAKHLFYYNDKMSMFSWMLIIAVIMFLLCLATQSGFFIFLLAVLIVAGIPFSIYITYLDWDIMYNCYKNEYKIGLLYNKGLLVIEKASAGHTIIDRVRNDYHYENIYKYKAYDQKSGKQRKQLGWDTNGKSKPMMIADLQEWFERGMCLVNSKDLLQEMKFFQLVENKMQAVSGHDDTVMAFAMAIQGLKSGQYYFPIGR